MFSFSIKFKQIVLVVFSAEVVVSALKNNYKVVTNPVVVSVELLQNEVSYLLVIFSLVMSNNFLNIVPNLILVVFATFIKIILNILDSLLCLISVELID